MASPSSTSAAEQSIPMQGIPTPSASHHRQKTKVPRVSLSPDTVKIAHASVHSVANDEAAAESSMSTAMASDSGDTQKQQLSYPPQTMMTAAAGSTSSSSASALSSPKASITRKHNVVNPYIKENCPASSVGFVDPELRRKQEFVEKYRARALEHGRGTRDAAVARSTSRGRGGKCRRAASAEAVSSFSALDLVRSSKQFRRSWQKMSCGGTTENERLRNNKPGGIMPLRPRLFLFRRRGRDDDRNSLRQQQQHHEGIWELGTGITELSGEGGSGKTQICLSLCVTCAMMPLLYPRSNVDEKESSSGTIHRTGVCDDHYTALYVTMGEGIPSARIAERLEKMVKARLRRDDPTEVKRYLSRIMLLSIHNEEEFVEFVEDTLPNYLYESTILRRRQQQQQHGHRQRQTLTKIGLVAFDGIAGFFRFSDPLFQRSANPMFHVQRSSRFLQISSQLRKLSDVYDVPILITNQVTAFSSLSAAPGEEVVPALGLAWSNCVATRYILQRKDGMLAEVMEENVRNQHDALKDAEEKKLKQDGKVMHTRKARVLQSVNMPEEREISFAIDTGEVIAI